MPTSCGRPLCGFAGDGVQHFHPQAPPGQPYAQIGVLGHVESVPAAQPPQRVDAKMVRGSSQWHGPAPTGQGRQEHTEQACIFAGKQRRQGIVVAIVDHQLGLQADDIGRLPKAHRCLPELVGIGPVLGIEHHHMFAPAERQGEIERLGLGVRRRIRHHHQREARIAQLRLHCRNRSGRTGLDDKFDIEAGGGIVQSFHGGK